MILILLIVFGVIFQAPAMFRSGAVQSYGIPYFGPLARDGVWHEALANQLKLSFPPENPGFAGTILTNYHYLYDLVVAGLSLLTKLPVRFFIYQFFPIVLSVFLGIGTYLLAQKLFKDKVVSLFAVFFTFFGSSFGWIVSLAKHEAIAGESDFWANQPVSMNLNPPYALSLVLLVFGALLLVSYLKKSSVVKGLFLTLIFGTLVGFKAYAGAVALAALFLLTLKKVIMDKSYSLVPVFLGSSAVFAAIYFIISRGGASLIEFQPFWLINTMIDAGDRVGIANFTARRFAYLGGKKWFNFAAIEFISFLIFLIGNMGTRIVSVLALKKKFLKSDLHLFILFLAVASFVPPLLFIQKGNPWNIIQFFYYFMFFAGLYAAFALRKLPVILIIIILVITPISSAATFRSWLYPNPPAYLPTGEYQALKFLGSQPEGTVLKYPYNQFFRNNYKDPYPLAVYADNSYVSAYSGHPVFIEDSEQQIILDTDYKARLENAQRFFVEKDLRWSKNFLLANRIKYIYLPKIYHLPMAEQEYPMVKIFENSDANIYQVK